MKSLKRSEYLTSLIDAVSASRDDTIYRQHSPERAAIIMAHRLAGRQHQDKYVYGKEITSLHRPEAAGFYISRSQDTIYEILANKG